VGRDPVEGRQPLGHQTATRGGGGGDVRLLFLLYSSYCACPARAQPPPPDLDEMWTVALSLFVVCIIFPAISYALF